MSITKSKSYTTTDGAVHATLELAQRAELMRLLRESHEGKELEQEHAELVAGHLIDRRGEFIAILCASGRKPRTKKPAKRGKKIEISE